MTARSAKSRFHRHQQRAQFIAHTQTAPPPSISRTASVFEWATHDVALQSVEMCANVFIYGTVYLRTNVAPHPTPPPGRPFVPFKQTRVLWTTHTQLSECANSFRARLLFGIAGGGAAQSNRSGSFQLNPLRNSFGKSCYIYLQLIPGS